MKKLIAVLLLLFAVLDVAAQVPYMAPSGLKPTWGFVRKSPCQAGAGDACGTNPPTWHITPAQCGFFFSTSSARNEDGSISTKGIRFTLPTVAELLAAGYQPSGASPLSSPTNREGQCEVSFVVAAPAPENYLRISIDGGVLGTDKLTNLGEGNSFDAYAGDLVFNHGWGIIRFRWNGVSWLYDGDASNGDRINFGQLSSHGQGRLFVVTADPSWWTVGSKIGHLAWCPVNGRGIGVNSNSHPTMILTPVGCVFSQPSGSSVDLIQLRAGASTNLSAISQGAAYGAGTAPNGKAYPAGNYTILTIGGTSGQNMQSGDTVTVWNAPTTLGSTANGKWLVKVIDSTHIELHEAVEDWDHMNLTGVGAPSSFVVGDTILGGNTSRAAITYTGMGTVALAGGRYTDPATGLEWTAGTKDGAIVGLARVTADVYGDSGSTRDVASFFNPVEKMCEFQISADKTTTSTTFVEVDNTRRCNFVYTDGISSKAKALGDTGRRVRYSVQAAVSNNTAAAGCDIDVNFDGGAAESTAPPGFLNPAGITGGQQMLTLTSNKAGLTEGGHTLRLMWRETGAAGTCSMKAAGTTVRVWIWQ